MSDEFAMEVTMSSLAGKTLFISGASRGIGLAVALRAVRDRRQDRGGGQSRNCIYQ